MELERWNPFSELDDMGREIDRLCNGFIPAGRRTFFGAPFPALRSEEGVASAAVDVIDKKDAVVVRAEMPGIDREKIDITIEKNTLAITGTVKKDEEVKGEDYYHRERRHTSFSRKITLPTKVDEKRVKATFRDGLLEVNLPKAEKAEPKKIAVEVK